jgi:hypothetical protein
MNLFLIKEIRLDNKPVREACGCGRTGEQTEARPVVNYNSATPERWPRG